MVALDAAQRFRPPYSGSEDSAFAEDCAAVDTDGTGKEAGAACGLSSLFEWTFDVLRGTEPARCASPTAAAGGSTSGNELMSMGVGAARAVSLGGLATSFASERVGNGVDCPVFAAGAAAAIVGAES